VTIVFSPPKIHLVLKILLDSFRDVDSVVIVHQVSFQVSYQVAGGTKTLTSCQVSGCALTMPVKAGQPVTVFVTASVAYVTSDEATAVGNTS